MEETEDGIDECRHKSTDGTGVERAQNWDGEGISIAARQSWAKGGVKISRASYLLSQEEYGQP